MAGNEFLDKAGLASLWERIRQLVYECGCQCKVTYTLEVDGNTLTLVGSDGSKSVVNITAVAECEGGTTAQ